MIDDDFYDTRPAHLYTLFACKLGLGWGEHLVPHQVTAQRSARTARRGVFKYPESRGEHTRVNARPVELCFLREEEDPHHAKIAKDPFRGIESKFNRLHGFQIFQRHVEKGYAARDDFKRQARLDGLNRKGEHLRNPAYILHTRAE